MRIEIQHTTFENLQPWLDTARSEGAHLDPNLKSSWTLLKAEYDTHLLGFVGLLHRTRRYATIRGWYVCPGYRSSGIGTQLLEAAVDLASTLGIEQVDIRTNRTHPLERLGFDWTGYTRKGGNHEEHWVLSLARADRQGVFL